MTSADLNKLAERCEAATGPDRELDAAIVLALNPGAEFRPYREGKRVTKCWLFGADGRVIRYGGPEDMPAYTTSLDAAMTLVPDSMGASVSRHGKRGDDCEAYVGKSDSDARGNFMTQTAHGNAKTMALALTAAALRARAALSTTPDLSRDEGRAG